MDSIYAIEDYNTGEFTGYKTLESARLALVEKLFDTIDENSDYYIRNKYDSIPIEEYKSRLANFRMNLKSIMTYQEPYIEDIAYCRKIDIVG